MKSDVKTYVAIAQGSGDESSTSVVPEGKLAKLLEKGEAFTETARISYFETEFESLSEFLDLPGDEDVKRDILNRGWVSYQQVAAKALVQAEDYQPSTEPIDITEAALSPRERRRAKPEEKSRKGMMQLAKENPAAFLALMEEFKAAAEAMQGQSA